MAHIQCNFYSKTLQKNANVIVFLPTLSADDYLEGTKIRYDAAGGKYQTLYLLHGSYGDCTDWTRFSGIERYAQKRTLAVVMPSGENSNYVNMKDGEPYLRYITEELPQFLRTVFPLSQRREDTFIAGLSMGGYGAFRCALEAPDQYQVAASLSGALDIQALRTSEEAHAVKMPANYKAAVFGDKFDITGTDDDLFSLLHKRVVEGAALPKLYMTCGTEDFIRPGNEKFFTAARMEGVDIRYDRAPGVHDWDFWDEHIRDVVKLLPLEEDLVF